jgi:uncharacterized protein YbbC (DUF1343 family)
LNGRRVPGVRFVPVRFKPTTSVFKNEDCSGINIVITDRARFQSVFTGLEVAVALHSLYPSDWKVDSYLRLLVNADALNRLKQGASADELTRSWRPALENFQRQRARALIYQ